MRYNSISQIFLNWLVFIPGIPEDLKSFPVEFKRMEKKNCVSGFALDFGPILILGPKVNI